PSRRIGDAPMPRAVMFAQAPARQRGIVLQASSGAGCRRPAQACPQACSQELWAFRRRRCGRKRPMNPFAGWQRRKLLATVPGLALTRAGWALPQRRLVFPADHGAHPDLRTEWWYITGQAQSGGRTFGFQVTFFRARVDATQGMQSRFAARQLLFAHAAVTDVQGARLWHDQRIAREGFDIAQAATGDARVRLRDWSLVREGGAWHAVLGAGQFAMDLPCAPT